MTRQGISRLDFLRGRFQDGPSPVRPPWALPEEQFRRLCSRCDACIKVCPESILVAGRGGFPTVDFTRGACTFCRLCLDKCQDGALSVKATTHWNGAPWGIKATIKTNCLAMAGVICRSCGDECEQNAIKLIFRPNLKYVVKIDIDQCTGCGACFRVCPSASVELATSNMADPPQ